MKHSELIRKHLKAQHVMQLATMAENRPWICTVYYVADDKFNLYWASLPIRRHSQELSRHPKVAAAISVQSDIGKKVIGLQVEGTAKMVDDKTELYAIAKLYAKRFGRDEQWVEDFANNKTEHKLYKLTPKNVVLFDEQNFPPGTKIEWQPTSK